MKSGEPIIYVVDDDKDVQEAIKWLLQSVHLHARCFASGADFLDDYEPGTAGCVILDVRMPGMSGRDVQNFLVTQKDPLPIIFLTGHGDIPMATNAMKEGAFQFIEKPFNNQILVDTVQHAVRKSEEILDDVRRRQTFASRIETLTEREREVLRLLVDGAPNKVIAHSLGITARTVEVHRARVMDKLQVRSVSLLIREIVETGAQY